jgi:hypothetical protein
MFYTIVLDWNGGTFLSQVHANSVDLAIRLWVGKFDPKVIGVESLDLGKILEALSDEVPTPVQGLDNVWCLCFFLLSKMAIVHVIATRDVLESE